MCKRFPGFRRFIVFAGDLFIVAVCYYAATFLVIAYTQAPIEAELYNRMLLIMLGVVSSLLAFNKLLALKRKKYREIFVDLSISTVQMIIIMLAISFVLREFTYSRRILLLAAALQFAGLAWWNRLWWQREYAGMSPRRVLIMGNTEECESLVVRLRLQAHLKDQVKYIVRDCQDESWQEVMGDVDVVIVSSSLELARKAEMLRYCQLHGKRVFIVPSFYELYCSNVELDKIDDIPVFRPRYLNPAPEQRILKRILDLAVAVAALVGLFPLLLLVALAIKLDSPGPVFYSQIRVGKDEHEFWVHKFRTMCQDAEKQTGPVLAAENDPRITRVGRFLRATRMDELPQLFNVLRGEMSIVGPRPERPFFVETLKKELPEYVHRSNVKPGITGMAQVYGKYNTTPLCKLMYDLLYIQDCDVVTDLALILKTLRVLVSKESTAGVQPKKAAEPLSAYDVSSRKKGGGEQPPGAG